MPRGKKISSDRLLEIIKTSERPLNLSELSRLTDVSERYVLKQLRVLVKTGHVRRTQDLMDMRSFLYSLIN